MLFSVGGQSQQSRSQHGEGPGTRWKADGAAGHRGRTGRRAVLPPRLGWHVCRIVAPGPLRKLGGLLLVSHRRARTGARGQRRRGRAQGGGALRAQRPRRPVPGALGGCASSVEPEKIEPGLRRKRTFTNPPNVSLEELIQIDEEDLRLLPPVGCWTRGTNRTWRGKSVSRGTTRDDQWACRLLRALVPPSPVRVRAGVGTEASGPGLCRVDRDFVEL